MYKLIFPASYRKKEVKFLKKHPELFERYRKILGLLQLDPYHPSLRLHKIATLNGLYSISLTMKYRIIIDFAIEGEKIVLINIGLHDEVY